MRLAEVVGTFSLAVDAAMGLPAEHGLRAAAAAVRLGQAVGAPAADLADAYYLAMLRYVGCTSDSHLAADVMGDEIAVRSALYGVDFFSPGEFLPRFVRAIGSGKGPLRGTAEVVRALAKMPTLLDTGRAHCEVADRLAERIGFDAGFRSALYQTFERWDGRGIPRKVAGEGIALSMRLVHAAAEIEIGHRMGGADGARAVVKKRAGKLLDPALSDALAAKLDDVCAALEGPSAWNTALEIEPSTPRTLDDAQLDEVLRAMGHFADLKSRFTRAHSGGVARLARAAAAQMRLGAAAESTLERAGLAHDLGRAAVSAAVWDKPGPLSDLDWERVRSHTYVGERILSRAAALAPIAEVATLAHERLDGSGYHRKLTAAACPAPARILAAADVYQALREDRPHRPARGPDEAAGLVSEMARAGTLCPDAVAAVLAAAGHAVRPKMERPAGLTDREVEVLRLVARGLTNKEVARALGISTKTAGNHIQNIFEKIAVTTRAAAAMFAMQRGLVA